MTTSCMFCLTMKKNFNVEILSLFLSVYSIFSTENPNLSYSLVPQYKINVTCTDIYSLTSWGEFTVNIKPNNPPQLNSLPGTVLHRPLIHDTILYISFICSFVLLLYASISKSGDNSSTDSMDCYSLALIVSSNRILRPNTYSYKTSFSNSFD